MSDIAKAAAAALPFVFKSVETIADVIDRETNSGIASVGTAFGKQIIEFTARAAAEGLDEVAIAQELGELAARLAAQVKIGIK